MNNTLNATMNALEIAQQYYTHFNSGNKAGMLALVDDTIRHEPNQGNIRIGKELFSEFLDKMDVAYSEKLTDMVFFTSSTEGRVAVEFTVNGIYKMAEEGLPPAHGQTYILPAAAFLEIHNGLITRVTTYYNLELWIALVSK